MGVVRGTGLRVVRGDDEFAETMTGEEVMTELTEATDEVLTRCLPSVPVADPLRPVLEDLASRYRDLVGR